MSCLFLGHPGLTVETSKGRVSPCKSNLPSYWLEKRVSDTSKVGRQIEVLYMYKYVSKLSGFPLLFFPPLLHRMRKIMGPKME